MKIDYVKKQALYIAKEYVDKGYEISSIEDLGSQYRIRFKNNTTEEYIQTL